MKKTLLLISLMFSFGLLQAQKISYSVTDKDDIRDMNFEIIGKVGGNYNVYKNFKSRHDICIYDNDMVLKNRVKMDFLPDRVINVEFVSYPDFCYMIYQYQKRGVLYCSMAKINGEGKLMTDPVILDTTQTTGLGENKIYSVINSDDKKKIMVFKVKRLHERRYEITSLLHDNQMSLLKKSAFYLQTSDREWSFTDFLVDNDGDFIFGRCGRTGSREYINKLDLIYKQADQDKPIVITLELKDKTLDEVKLKFDNYNKRIVATSLYYKQKRGNIDGLYSIIWDKKNQQIVKETNFQFNDSLRLDAKGDNGSLKTAFNDHFIRQIIPSQEGGFVITTESYFSSSKANSWNRFDYLYGNSMMYPFDFGYYSPLNRMNYLGMYDPFNRFNQNNLVRHSSENIMVFYFGADGKLQWSNTIRKNQYDDNIDSYISFTLFNTGNELRFLFNQKEKRELLLNSATIDGDGKLKRQPTLKNLSRDYDFMPKFGKQVGLRQIILPCMYKNYICFAKLEF